MIFHVDNSRRISFALAATVFFSIAVTEPAQATWEWATGPSIQDKEGKRDWGIEVVPYLWLAGLEGRIALPASGDIPIDSSFSSLAENLEAGFAGVIDLRYRRWHLISDNSWVRLSIDAVPDPPLITSWNLQPAIAFGTVALAYELPLKKSFAVDVYLAARWWHVSVDAQIATVAPPSPPAGSSTESWADAVVGSRIRYAITDNWNVSANADIGGGNASLDWSVYGGLGYDFNDYFGLTAGYRILGVDYENQGFVYDTRQSGLLLGIKLSY